MKINVIDQILEYENNVKIIEEMFNKINENIQKSGLILSHLSIDGNEVYDDFYNYFFNNIKEIKEVNVITKTLKEISKETIILTLDYIERAVPEIIILSNEFYKTPTQDTWNKLSDVFEGINWIIRAFISIDSNVNSKNVVSNYEEWNVYAQDIYSLKELIIEFEEIMQSNDLVSIADILSYEITPLFNSMKEKLEKLVY